MAVHSLWRQTYPRDPKAFSLSGGYAANGTGRFEQVVELSAKSVELEPDQLYGYINQATALFRLGRFEEAEKAFAVAAAHHATGAGFPGVALPSRVVETGQGGHGENPWRRAAEITTANWCWRRFRLLPRRAMAA